MRVTTKGRPSDDLVLAEDPAAPDRAGLVSGSARVRTASLIMVGEVYNGTSASQAPAIITVKLYNAAGHLLATRTGRTDSTSPRGADAVRIVGSVPAGYAKAIVTAAAVSTKRPWRPGPNR